MSSCCTFSVGALSCALFFAVCGCAGSRASSASAAPSPVAHPVKIGDVRIVERKVNLMEPLMVGFAGGDVGITVARHGRDGVNVAVDPTSLEARTTTPFEYRPHDRRRSAPCQDRSATTVTLADGASLAIWNDTTTGRLLARYSKGGEPIAITPEDVAVIGGAEAATADGRHVVVTFFGGNEHGFHLMATSLEVAP